MFGIHPRTATSSSSRPNRDFLLIKTHPFTKPWTPNFYNDRSSTHTMLITPLNPLPLQTLLTMEELVIIFSGATEVEHMSSTVFDQILERALTILLEVGMDFMADDQQAATVQRIKAERLAKKITPPSGKKRDSGPNPQNAMNSQEVRLCLGQRAVAAAG